MRTDDAIERLASDPASVDLFWARVNVEGECWLWTGPRDRDGYGKVGLHRVLAHRLAWTIAAGRITDGKRVLHRCDVRACCNPAHLFLGTQGDNMRDMA